MDSMYASNNGKIPDAAFIRGLIFRLADICAVTIGVFLAHVWRFGSLSISERYVEALVLGLLLVLIVFPVFGLYKPIRGRTLYVQIRGLLLASTTVIVLLTMIAFLTKTGDLFSRQWFVVSSVLTIFFLIGFRVLATWISRFFIVRTFGHVRVGIVGAGTLGKKVVDRLREIEWAGYSVGAMYDDNKELIGTKYEDITISGMQELMLSVKHDKLDEIWFALPFRSEDRLKQLMHELRHAPMTMRFVPNIFAFRLLNQSVEMLGGVPIVTLNCSPMVGANRFLKACEDKLLAVLFLLLASPAMLVIALAIKCTSPGPVLFKQDRHGWGGRPISVWKFRTMLVHQEDAGRVTQASRNDLRITGIGRFLRRTSLDELPQLINVLQGSMSIVGPRPHAIAHNEEYKDVVDDYMARHQVKPGITGWAQINGYRGETETIDKMEKRVEFDLYYIRHWSLWLDIKIIVLTFFKGFLNANAY